MFGNLLLLGLGVFGVFVCWRAVSLGEVRVVWSALGGWGTLASSHTREESPLIYWTATILYGGAGVLLTIFAASRLLMHH